MTALPSANDVRARLDAYFGARPAFRPAPWLTADEPPGHRVLALEGMPGVGKTTLARALRNDDTEVLEEERDELVLNRFLINPEAYAFLFQMYKLSRRQQRCTDLVVQLGRRLPAAARTTIIDRHLPGDMGFALYQYACGRFTDPELDEYMHRAMRIPHAVRLGGSYMRYAIIDSLPIRPGSRLFI